MEQANKETTEKTFDSMESLASMKFPPNSILCDCGRGVTLKPIPEGLFSCPKCGAIWKAVEYKRVMATKAGA